MAIEFLARTHFQRIYTLDSDESEIIPDILKSFCRYIEDLPIDLTNEKSALIDHIYTIEQLSSQKKKELSIFIRHLKVQNGTVDILHSTKARFKQIHTYDRDESKIIQQILQSFRDRIELLPKD